MVNVMVMRLKNLVQKIVEVINIADPSDGARAYFTAASLANFNEIILLRVGRNCGEMMKVAIAKAQFIENGLKFPGFRNTWYFCKRKDNTPQEITSGETVDTC